MKEGHQVVRVAKVKTQYGGKACTTKKGDPCIYVTFEDSEGADADNCYMLTGKMVWKLGDLVEACGTYKQTLKDSGIEPTMFAVQAIADQYLLNKDFMALVTKRGDFFDVIPAPAKAGSTTEKEPPAQDDIGF